MRLSVNLYPNRFGFHRPEGDWASDPASPCLCSDFLRTNYFINTPVKVTLSTKNPKKLGWQRVTMDGCDAALNGKIFVLCWSQIDFLAKHNIPFTFWIKIEKL